MDRDLFEEVLSWLVDSDPAIRWQVQRDLLDKPESVWGAERELISETGWGKRLLYLQEPDGKWGGGLYSPKWISTTYTLLLLRRFGLPHENEQAQRACRLLLKKGVDSDGGINLSSTRDHSEMCVTGLVLSLCAYFRLPESDFASLVDYILEHRMADGAWNCQKPYGAAHSSFHTTINVLEGLSEYIAAYGNSSEELAGAMESAEEFFLRHRLYQSHRTGKPAKPEFTRFSFPPRWHHDVLRTLEYFRQRNVSYDPRFGDAIAVVKKKRRNDGRWPLQNRHPGKEHFAMEQPGKSSHWNTLRSIRVLQWWDSISEHE